MTFVRKNNMTFIVPIKVHCLLTSNRKTNIKSCMIFFHGKMRRNKVWVARKLLYKGSGYVTKENVGILQF